MRAKRSERLVEMVIYFMQNPHTITPLNYFSDRFQIAKSSVSEDLAIIKEVFEQRHVGQLTTYAGARGGVLYEPTYDREAISRELENLCAEISGSQRLLPGGYIYITDLLGNPKWLKRIGRIIASKYSDQEVDVIMTIATKGVPLAQAVAYHLNVPFVIVRNSSKVTEGSTVSINYQPRVASDQVEKMVLSKRSLAEGSRVLLIDDFLREGSTMWALMQMAWEFQCEVVDAVVLLAHESKETKLDYHSLLRVEAIDPENKEIKVQLGDFLDSMERVE